MINYWCAARDGEEEAKKKNDDEDNHQMMMICWWCGLAWLLLVVNFRQEKTKQLPLKPAPQQRAHFLH